MLRELQERLLSLYALDAQPDVEEFLVTEHALANTLSGDRLNPFCRETLLLDDCGDALNLSLYLDQALIDEVRQSEPLNRLQTDDLPIFAELLEGLSHFIVAVYKAQTDRQLSLFELELQAEIDKFVTTASLWIEQRGVVNIAALHERLFERFRWVEGLTVDEQMRYVDANSYAARYCYRLMPAIRTRVLPTDELRTFFRLPPADKVAHITALGW